MFWCEHYSKKLGWQLNKKKKRKENCQDLMWIFPIHWSEELWCYTFDQQNPGKEPESEESGRRMELRLNSEERREDWSSISHVINGIMKCNIMNIKFIMGPYLMKKENLTSYFLTLKWKKKSQPIDKKMSAEKKWKDSRKNIGFLTDKDSITKYPLGFT